MTVGAVAVQSNRKPARVAAATLPVVGVVCSEDQLGGIDVVSSAHVWIVVNGDGSCVKLFSTKKAVAFLVCKECPWFVMKM